MHSTGSESSRSYPNSRACQIPSTSGSFPRGSSQLGTDRHQSMSNGGSDQGSGGVRASEHDDQDRLSNPDPRGEREGEEARRPGQGECRYASSLRSSRVSGCSQQHEAKAVQDDRGYSVGVRAEDVSLRRKEARRPTSVKGSGKDAKDRDHPCPSQEGDEKEAGERSQSNQRGILKPMRNRPAPTVPPAVALGDGMDRGGRDGRGGRDACPFR
jgi:hypothetical protein